MTRNSTTLTEILGIFDPLFRIKFKKRKGWVERDLRSDTISAHILDAIFAGWYLSKKENMDSDKIIMILLIHDLVMAYMKDITPRSKKYLGKKDLEDIAFEKLLDKTPELLKGEYKSLWKEYQNMQTAESRLSREADKLATLLQAYKYSLDTNKDILKEFLSVYKDKFYSKTGKKLWESLVEERKKQISSSNHSL